jgi:hypothetical protein
MIWVLRCVDRGARRQVLETLTSISAQRLVIRYSLGEEQSLDAIDVLGAVQLSNCRF